MYIAIHVLNVFLECGSQNCCRRVDPAKSACCWRFCDCPQWFALVLCTSCRRHINPFSTAVPIRGQTCLIPSDLSPKRDWGPKRVNAFLFSFFGIFFRRFSAVRHGSPAYFTYMDQKVRHALKFERPCSWHLSSSPIKVFANSG